MRKRTLLVAVAAFAIVIFYLFPVYWIVTASLQPGAGARTISWIPTSFDLSSYASAWDGAERGLYNSLIISVGTVALTLLISIPAAYALSMLRSRWVPFLMVLVLIGQMIPGIVLAISLYAIFNQWGLLNSYLGLILANTTNAVPFAVILLRSFMTGMEKEVLEAATLDGLNQVGILRRIVVPLSINGIVSAGIFSFLFTWSDLLFGLALTTDSAVQPVVMHIYQILNADVISWATIMAASLISSVPALVLLLMAQRQVKAGVAMGSGK